MPMPKFLRKEHSQVIYQIYPRSFQDSDGDGVGDLPGILSRLDYLAGLGVDYIWISPFLKSPQKDFGYDVSDYLQVDPSFGTNEDFDRLIAEAKKRGLKVMMDIVIAHTSNEHHWFKESRMSRDNKYADWYVWRDAKPDGTPPNNWLSVFGGPAWIWESRRDQYYLTHFLKEQPAVNFYNPAVEDEFLNVFKFWLDRGVQGFRLDAIHFAHFDEKLRNNPAKKRDAGDQFMGADRHPFSRQDHRYDWAQPATAGLLKKIRKLADQYKDIVLLGEVSGSPSLKVARDYTKRGHLHLSYTFDLIGYPEKLNAKNMRAIIDDVRHYLPDGGYSWALGNHDSPRFVSRIEPKKPELHPAVSRCYIALLLALPGSVCLYQGDELSLPQAQVPFEDLQDPYDKEFYPYHVGRDGARTPFPWDAQTPQAGFSTAAKTWLPVSSLQLPMAADQQENEPNSVLNDVKKLFAFRRSQTPLLHGHFDWDEGEDYLAFTRSYKGSSVHAIFNLSDRDLIVKTMPKGERVGIDRCTLAENGVVMPPYSFEFWVEK